MNPIVNFFVNTYSTTEEVLTHTTKVLAAPFITYRPDEFLYDTFTLISPFSAHTDRCVHYIKRCIRNSILFNEKINGIVSFRIDPKDSYLFSSQKVDKDAVVQKINDWLLLSKHDPLWPKKISWIDPLPLHNHEGKIVKNANRGNVFIINNWESGNVLTSSSPVSTTSVTTGRKTSICSSNSSMRRRKIATRIVLE